MKKLNAILLTLMLTFTLTACSGNVESPPAQSTVQTQPDVSASSEASASIPNADTELGETSASIQPEFAAESANKDTLVVYFSATGTTKSVAEQIASITDADLYEITPAQEYTSDDLDWNDSNSRSTKEQDDPAARPEIGSAPVSLEGYSTIYIGYPIWWGEEPRIMDTFVESYDFDGITMIPFCTSSSSGMGRSGQNLADKAGSGTWLEGKRFGAGAAEEEIASWISTLQ